jgi:hypothetical protein
MRRRLLGVLYFAPVGAMLAAIPIVGAIGVWSSWESDNAVLREQAAAVTAGQQTSAAKISAISHWVHRNQGFAKNDRFFLIPALGPTPIQVLESGGDCADKSKLVSAMLWQLGIASGLAQIFPCENCGPIHVFVEAEYEYGRMVVDPLWDIDYPTADGRFLGIQELAGTSRGREHVAGLQWQRGIADKIRNMPQVDANFDFARAVNWQKNVFTRALADGLRLLGYAPESLLRPHFLEDPKLAIALFLFAVAGILAVLSCLLGLAWPDAAARFRSRYLVGGLPGAWQGVFANTVERSAPAVLDAGAASDVLRHSAPRNLHYHAELHPSGSTRMSCRCRLRRGRKV